MKVEASALSLTLAEKITVIPENSGIQILVTATTVMDTRLRGYDVTLIAGVRDSVS